MRYDVSTKIKDIVKLSIKLLALLKIQTANKKDFENKLNTLLSIWRFIGIPQDQYIDVNFNEFYH